MRSGSTLPMNLSVPLGLDLLCATCMVDGGCLMEVLGSVERVKVSLEPLQ